MSVTSEIIPLPYLQIGQFARVEELLGDDAEVKRLEEIGIRTGERVEMIQNGTPCIVRIGDCKLCFRTCDVLQVLVRIGEAG